MTVIFNGDSEQAKPRRRKTQRGESVLHKSLSEAAGRFLKNKMNCGLVGVGVRSTAGEEPDAIGWRSGVFGKPTSSILIEVKVSRSDFLADRKKLWRRDPSIGVGDLRYYLAPAGLLSASEMPPGWGLIEALPGKRVRLRVVHGYGANRFGLWHESMRPFIFDRCNDWADKALLYSVARRLS